VRRRALQAFAAAVVGWAVLSPRPLSSAAPPAALAQQPPSSLTPGGVIDRTVRGGERQTFSIDLSAGDFVHVVIDQRGADVAIRLQSPDGTTLVASDSPNSTSGPERIAWVAAAAGAYQVVVESGAPSADQTPRSYQLRVVARRPAGDRDVMHARAEQLLAEAAPQLRTNTAVSRGEARKRYESAAAVFETLGLEYERGLCLYSLGILELRQSDARTALGYLRRAQSLFARNDPMYASVVNALGGAFDLVGDPEAASASYREALEGFRAIQDRGREAVARNNLGKVAADMADWPGALEQYRLALLLFRETGDRRREALALYNIGMSYASMGDLERSGEYLQQSLTIRRAINDRAGQADSLTRLGIGEGLAGRPRAAISYYDQALPLRTVVGDKSSEGVTLTYLGEAQLAAGEPDQALDSLQRAVALRGEGGDRRGRALAVSSLADAYATTGRPEQALARANESLAVFREMGDRKGIALALPVVARALRQMGRLDDALRTAGAALDALEHVRGGALSPDMRAAYLGRFEGTYAFAIDLLMQLDRDRPDAGFGARALQMSERAKARSLLEMLAEGGSAVRQGVDPALADRERQIARLLDSKADRLFAAQGARSAGEAETLAKEAQTLEAEYDEVRARIRASSPEYSALTQPQPLDIGAIRRDVLDDDTTLVEYALGPDASYVWVLDRRGLNTYRLAPRAEIERAAREAYELVTSRATNVPREAAPARTRRIAASDAALPAALRRVSNLVLAPIAAFPTTSRLLVVADGALQYLPFEMLPAPRRPQPLVVDFEITALPSASTLAVHRTQLARRPAPTKGVAVFADPVFTASDARVRQTRVASAAPAAPEAQTRLLTQTDDPATPGFGSIARLRFTDEEAKAILAAAQGRQNFAAVGFDATKAAAVDAGLGTYRYLHFATHGFLDTARPSLSAIALSLVTRDGAAQEGFLRAHELYNLSLSADLVVLSACQTGLGKEIRGEGLIGLTRAFMYAGAARVIVSLWSVSDRATASLMSRLYREMLRNGRTPSASLRAAQLALRSDARWQHPYYWAAFTIQGDWK
jgi:CHAT domain-containing protein/Tfp pilus assembly protein PilF